MQPARQQKKHYLFKFNASAVAVAANARRNSQLLTADEDRFFCAGVSALSPIGGSCTNQSGPQVFRNGLISFQRAASSVFGDFKNPKSAAKFTRGNWCYNALPAVTRISAEVAEAVEVNQGPGSRREVRTPWLKFTLTFDHGRDGNRPRVSLAPELAEMIVDGQVLKVTLVGREFLRLATLDDFRKAYDNKAFRAKFGTCFFPIGQTTTPAEPARRFPIDRGNVFCTVVDKIQWADQRKAPPGTRIVGRNRIEIAGFGAIALGEYQISETSRTISMARTEFGSPDGGDGEKGGGGGGDFGQGWPP